MLEKNKFNELITAMGNHSIQDNPREACGIITKDFQYYKAKNISLSPKTSFVINPLDIIKHDNNIWGFFHSHPNSLDPVPSTKDLKSTVFNEYRFIVGFADNFYIYWLENDSLAFERFDEHHCKI